MPTVKKGINSMFDREKVFKAEKDIKYLFFKSHKKSPNLIVVFSGIPVIGTPPRYNYVKTLEGYNCNKLFILDDFGCRASYYLCNDRDYAIERSVISLINHIAKENDVSNILACGSSKGGYASLYYGIKYGFQHIIAASPQFLLGEYLLRYTNSENIASFMAGGPGEEDFEYLNSIMAKMIERSDHKPNILVHVGEGEYHYKVHVKPLLKLLEQKNIDYRLDLGNYSGHGDVAIHFPPVLKENISNAFNFPIINCLKELPKEESNKRLYVLETKSADDVYAFYLLRNGERIEFRNYSKDNTYTPTFEGNGKYSVTAFAKSPQGLIVSAKSKPIPNK